MLRCSQCGVSLGDQALFCPHCGGAVAPIPTEESTSTTKSAAGILPSGPTHGSSSGENLPIAENIAGVVAYITILPAIAFLLVEPFKRNFFVRFHSFQHLFLWVAGFVIGTALGILGTLLQLIPFMRVLVFPLAGLISLAWFFLWVLLVVKAYHHQLFKLPIIGDLAQQRAGG